MSPLGELSLVRSGVLVILAMAVFHQANGYVVDESDQASSSSSLEQALRPKRVMTMSKFAFLPDKFHLDLGQEGAPPKRGSRPFGNSVAALWRQRRRNMMPTNKRMYEEDEGAMRGFQGLKREEVPYPYYFYY